MNDERNIDRLFQESFKDFEVDAPKGAWDNIEKSLIQKTNKPLIPLWQKFAGVAALIAIAILAGSQWFITPNVNNSIVDSPKVNATDEQTIPTEPLNNRFVDPNTQNINSNTVVTSDNGDTNSNSVVTSNGADARFDETNTRKAEPALLLTSNLNLITTTNNTNSTQAVLQTTSPLNKTDAYDSSALPDNSGNDNFSSLISSLNSKTLEQELQTDLRTNQINLENDESILPNQKSLVEVAAQMENEKPALTDKKGKSWSVKPQISPVFYGNLGSGSAIDQNFNQSSGQSEVNISYGINVAYKVNKKMKIRTGINRVNLNYNTNDVFVLTTSGFSNFNNVDVASSFQNSVISRAQLSALEESTTLLRLPTEESQLQQQLGYIEVPMELEYKVIDSKVDVHIIGGASTLLLNENSLDIQTGNRTTFLGEANNANDLSFSTNFAIGFGYDISEKLILSLEPTFKYQFNTFQSGTSDFQPFFMGVYSGVVFKF